MIPINHSSRRAWLRNGIVASLAATNYFLPNSLAGLLANVNADEKQLARASIGNPRLPRDKLLLYRAANNEPMAVKTPEDWAHRRAEIVRGMEYVMGRLPGDEKRCPFDMNVDEEVDCGKYVRRLISFAQNPIAVCLHTFAYPRQYCKGERKPPRFYVCMGQITLLDMGWSLAWGERIDNTRANLRNEVM